MLNSYKDFWKRYADFSGTSTRSQFWWTYLINFIICTALYIPLFLYYIKMMTQIISQTNYETYSSSVSILQPSLFTIVCSGLWFIYTLATICPNIAMYVRRLRDAGYNWPWLFISFVPIAGPIILIVLLAKKSKENA